MVLGFLRHMYQYFVPDDRQNRPQNGSPSPSRRPPPLNNVRNPPSMNLDNAVPIYDQHGRIISYIQLDDRNIKSKNNPFSPHIHPIPPLSDVKPPPPPSENPVTSKDGHILYSIYYKIQLGEWEHACDAQTAEDVLANPSSVPFSSDVHQALIPFLNILKALFVNPLNVDSAMVPAKAWLEQEKRNVATSPVRYSGSLTTVQRAEIANWFEVNISKSKGSRVNWIGLLPEAHAQTLYIVHSIREGQQFKDLGFAELL
ncbi:hypothetical protein H0H93_010660, partial [Arthromyces matolae]